MKHLVTIGLILALISACEILKKTPEEFPLDFVSSYNLIETATLLHQYEEQLDGLSLHLFFDESFKIIEQRNQENILKSGRKDEFPINQFELNNISDEYTLQTIAIQQFILTKLQSYDRKTLNETDKLSFDVYHSYLSDAIEWGKFINFNYPASYSFFGWPGRTEILFSEELMVNDSEEVELYLNLLGQIERRFSQIQHLLVTRQTAGIIEPAITLSRSMVHLEQVAELDARESPYYLTLNKKLNQIEKISLSQQENYRARLIQTIEQRVKPAYRKLARQLKQLLNDAPEDIGFSQFPSGTDFYNFTLRHYTSSNLTSEQVHQLGLSELARIHANMRLLFDRLGYPKDESIVRLLARAAADGGKIDATQALNKYQEIIAQTYPKLSAVFSQIPPQKVVVIGGDNGGYYIAGSDDATRPGAFYAYTTKDIDYWTMPSLTYHEAIPGHHFQVALAKEINFPRFRREMSFTAFVEGWGLYAERLADDLGWYDSDIYGDLGRLQFEAMRASRLVVDTGIHSKGWTFQQAQEFSQKNIGNAGSISRYSVFPGQATAYTIGMLKILELRDRAKNQLGNLYNIRDFHQVIIGKGSMPLHLLEQQVDNYIAEKLSAK